VYCIKVKDAHTLYIALLQDNLTPEALRYMARIVERSHSFTYTLTCLSTNGMKHAFAFPAELVFILPTLKGWKAESTRLAGYIPRWFTCPKTVTCSSTDQTWRWLTSLIIPTMLAIVPCHQPYVNMHACMHGICFLHRYRKQFDLPYTICYVHACCEHVLFLAASVCLFVCLHKISKTTYQKLIKLGRNMPKGEC